MDFLRVKPGIILKFYDLILKGLLGYGLEECVF